jgi:transposase-like protein
LAARSLFTNKKVLAAHLAAGDRAAVAYVAAALREHGTILAAARALGVSKRQLERWRELPELRKVRTKQSFRLTPEAAADMRRRFAGGEGETRAQIAKRYGCGTRTVSRALAGER